MVEVVATLIGDKDQLVVCQRPADEEILKRSIEVYHD